MAINFNIKPGFVLGANASSTNPGFVLRFIAIVISMIRLRQIDNDTNQKSFSNFLFFLKKCINILIIMKYLSYKTGVITVVTKSYARSTTYKMHSYIDVVISLLLTR